MLTATRETFSTNCLHFKHPASVGCIIGFNIFQINVASVVSLEDRQLPALFETT